ncbi:MAG TPA: hypothetical protein PLB78_02445 [Anaerolineae bacterium]|nr:hypothetical protein [Anaerolineae bacterium]
MRFISPPLAPARRGRAPGPVAEALGSHGSSMAAIARRALLLRASLLRPKDAVDQFLCRRDIDLPPAPHGRCRVLGADADEQEVAPDGEHGRRRIGALRGRIEEDDVGRQAASSCAVGSGSSSGMTSMPGQRRRLSPTAPRMIDCP